LAQGIDIFVNDAFGSSHRAHSSVVGIVDFVPIAAAGYLMKKEVDNLRKAIVNPAKPYVAILGGAKTEDKIPVIETLLAKADTILIGGAMAYTFFLAQGFQVGTSLVEPDKVDIAKDILKKAAEKGVRFLLPLDNLMTKSIESGVVEKIQEGFPYPADLMGVDIGPKTIALYAEVIAKAETIFWNGPLGVFEVPVFAQGTIRIAEAVAASGAVSIIGGGDSIAAVDKAGVSSKITHISTGGGASLEFVANQTLPGIEALDKKA
jgi:phosphoglycerate kinase